MKLSDQRVSPWRVICAAAIMAITPALAGAQEPDVIDTGRFELRTADGVVGTEVFAIRAEGDGIIAVGRISAVPGRGEPFRVGFRVAADFSLIRYDLRSRSANGPRIEVVPLGANRLQLTTRGARGERVKEVVAPPAILILEDGVAHHYYFLARRVVAANHQAGDVLRVLVPREGRVMRAAITGVSQVTAEVDGSSQRAVRIDLTVGGEERSVWTSRDGSRLIRVLNRSTGWEARRLQGG
ncbi:MAG: hypothetical protein V3U67_06725 [Gemmatimonadota bacterium]